MAIPGRTVRARVEVLGWDPPAFAAGPVKLLIDHLERESDAPPFGQLADGQRIPRSRRDPAGDPSVDGRGPDVQARSEQLHAVRFHEPSEPRLPSLVTRFCRHSYLPRTQRTKNASANFLQADFSNCCDLTARLGEVAERCSQQGWHTGTLEKNRTAGVLRSFFAQSKQARPMALAPRPPSSAQMRGWSARANFSSSRFSIMTRRPFRRTRIIPRPMATFIVESENDSISAASSLENSNFSDGNMASPSRFKKATRRIGSPPEFSVPGIAGAPRASAFRPRCPRSRPCVRPSPSDCLRRRRRCRRIFWVCAACVEKVFSLVNHHFSYHKVCQMTPAPIVMTSWIPKNALSVNVEFVIVLSSCGFMWISQPRTVPH